MPPMMPEEVEFRELLQQIQNGSQEAARTLFERYGNHILRVIRRRLDQKLRSKFDSCDFLQDVMVSFFQDPPPPEAFAGSAALFGYLATMAHNKVIDAVRGRRKVEKHNVNREHSLEGSAKVQADRVLGNGPTPSEVAMANEKWRGMLRGQPNHYQQILQMLRDGHSHVEIADTLKLNVKMVQRLVQKLRPRFQT
jgi:RNA polymerase sigma factor (sigma-70 family)